MAETLPADTRIGRTALRVSNLEELTDFYHDVVGLEILETTDETATLGTGDTPLLELESGPDLGPRPQTATGLYHNAFRVPDRAALGDALHRIQDNWRLEGASNHWVSEALYLSDPEDNGVEIYRDFPREEWPTDEDGHVQMTTEPLDLEPISTAASEDDIVPPETTVGHVHLEVSDLDTFEHVYVDALGFEVQTRFPQAVFVSAGGYHHHVGANTWHRRSTPAVGGGLAWFEVLVPDTDTLSGLEERLHDHAVTTTIRDDAVVVTDADELEIHLRVHEEEK